MVIALARRAGDPGSNPGPGENFSIKLLICNTSIPLTKILIRCYVWSVALYDSEIWTLRKLDLRNVIMEENGDKMVRESN